MPPPYLRPRPRWTFLTLTVLTATAIVLPRLGSAQTPCKKNCDAAFQDSKGCCPATAPSGPKTPAAPPSASHTPAGACPAGMSRLSGGSYARVARHDTATVHPFCMDVTEVTVDAYTACVRAGKCTAEATSGDGCNYGVSGKGNHPMNCLDWNQATTYCHAQGKRLPSEEEWEWAARGGAEGRTYPWGNTDPDSQLCWSGVTKREGTCPVGSYPAGDAPGGVHDLCGQRLRMDVEQPRGEHPHRPWRRVEQQRHNERQRRLSRLVLSDQPLQLPGVSLRPVTTPRKCRSAALGCRRRPTIVKRPK